APIRRGRPLSGGLVAFRGRSARGRADDQRGSGEHGHDAGADGQTPSRATHERRNHAVESGGRLVGDQTPSPGQGSTALAGQVEPDRDEGRDGREQAERGAARAPAGVDRDDDRRDEVGQEHDAVQHPADTDAEVGGVGDVLEDHAGQQHGPGDGLGDGDGAEQAERGHAAHCPGGGRAAGPRPRPRGVPDRDVVTEEPPVAGRHGPTVWRVSDFDYDVAVIGSGFGGSVTALRLVEKGYRVVVLEAGRRFADEEFAATSWQVRRYLWAPWARCFGLLRLTPLRNVLIASGVGVGGGSLVYANTLYQPGDDYFRDPRWSYITDWRAEL